MFEAGVPPAKQDALLDKIKFGPKWLSDARIAKVVADALEYGAITHRYDLYAWAVMPNHVHAIFLPHQDMATVMRWLKSRTSRVANRILGRSGAFW